MFPTARGAEKSAVGVADFSLCVAWQRSKPAAVSSRRALVRLEDPILTAHIPAPSRRGRGFGHMNLGETQTHRL